MAIIPEDMFTLSYAANTQATIDQSQLETKSSEEILAIVKQQQAQRDSLASLRERPTITDKGDNKLKEAEDANDFWTSKFNGSTYTSFSGADTKISIAFPKGEPIFLGEAQTLTYSLYRPMNPVYRLGSAKPVGYVRGQRTIAGSIIFTVFDRNAMIAAFHAAYARIFNNKDQECLDKFALTDELPPFDLHATFLNEYGQQAQLIIHDVRITSEGQVMSIEDMITENTMQYLASDITLMRPYVKQNNRVKGDD